MKVNILKVAQSEFLDAKEYYEIERSGLGKIFEKEIRQGIEKIKKFPEAWSVERPEIRRFILHKFPYKILYSIQKDEILILAFAHSHRKPDYWDERVKQLSKK